MITQQTVPAALRHAQAILATAGAVGEAGVNFAQAVRDAFKADVLQDACEIAVRTDFERAPAANAKEQSQRAGTWRTRLNNALAGCLPENTFVKVSVRAGKASIVQAHAGVTPDMRVAVTLETKADAVAVPEHMRSAERLAKGITELMRSEAVPEEAKAALREANEVVVRALRIMLEATSVQDVEAGAAAE